MSPERKFCVYVHRRDADGSIFYVGKGMAQRPYSSAGRSQRWKRIVSKSGLEVEIVKSGMAEACAFSLERAIIFSIGRERLANMTDGGEGTSGRIASHAQRLKCSISNRGTKPSRHSIELARDKNSKPIATRCGLRFASATDAAKKMRPDNWRAGKVGICAAAHGRNKTAYGYEWGYIVDGYPQFLYVDRIKKPDIRPHKWKAVMASNGMTFSAISHAVAWLRENGNPKAGTGGVCRAAKTGGKIYGLEWKYV